MTNQRGFTLLEVLVALGIVALISILSWQGLQEVLRSASRVSQVDEQIQTVSAVFSQLEQDLGALELTLNAPTPESDRVELTSNGLLIQYTQRNTSELAYHEQLEWVLEGTKLLRIARREMHQGQAFKQPSISEAIQIQGVQLRFLREPGGWSSPVFFGNPRKQENVALELAGMSMKLNTGMPAAAPPTNSEGVDLTTPQTQAVQTLVRAVEISLTQTNMEVLTRVFLTGGVH